MIHGTWSTWNQVWSKKAQVLCPIYECCRKNPSIEKISICRSFAEWRKIEERKRKQLMFMANCKCQWSIVVAFELPIPSVCVSFDLENEALLHFPPDQRIRTARNPQLFSQNIQKVSKNVSEFASMRWFTLKILSGEGRCRGRTANTFNLIYS